MHPIVGMNIKRARKEGGMMKTRKRRRKGKRRKKRKKKKKKVRTVYGYNDFNRVTI